MIACDIVLSPDQLCYGQHAVKTLLCALSQRCWW